MTVIAWDGRHLSSDRQTSGGGGITQTSKLHSMTVPANYKDHDALIAWACTGYVTNNYFIRDAIVMQAESMLRTKKLDLSQLVQDVNECDIRLQELALIAVKQGDKPPVAYALNGSGHLIEIDENEFYAVGSNDAVSHCLGFMSCYSSNVGALGGKDAVSDLAVLSANKLSEYCGFGVDTIDMVSGCIRRK